MPSRPADAESRSRPRGFLSNPFLEAVRTGLRAARQSLSAMLAIQALMAGVVASYYFWPRASALLQRLAEWQQSGGVLAAAIASSFAGGLLSETSAVYFQDGGRWTTRHRENAVFKMGLFLVMGAAVYEFYAQQAVWFGNGVAWSVLVPKIVVDQFIYTPLWSVPVQTCFTRWQASNYSLSRLRTELNSRIVTERMLPLLVANWMFWIPGVTFIYSMPRHLQMPLGILANAIWGLLLSATARQPNLTTGTVQDLVTGVEAPAPLAD